MSWRYDCIRCGACCTNTKENAAAGFAFWIEVEPASPLLGRKDLVRKLVVLDEEGTPHLRLGRDGRCLALRGTVGERVRCDVYGRRPLACRRVQPGHPDCEQARVDHELARPW